MINLEFLCFFFFFFGTTQNKRWYLYYLLYILLEESSLTLSYYFSQPCQRQYNNTPQTTKMSKTSNITNNEEQPIKSPNFLGIINRKYLSSFVGVIHFLSSVTALLLGNYLFLQRIILNNNEDQINKDTKIIFHISSALSGFTIFIAFYNKVQSWQLSTTTMEEKGLSPQQMQNFNKGRGVIAMIISPIFPLLYQCAPKEVLSHPIFTYIIGLIMFLITWHQSKLIFDYSKVVFGSYGLSKMIFAFHLLLTSMTLEDVQTSYPYMITFMEIESYMVVSCVQFGFLWYYLHSRKLVSKNSIQTYCKMYHPTVLCVWVMRITYDRWWMKLPWYSLAISMLLYTLYTLLFLSKVLMVNRRTDSSKEKKME